MVASHTSDIESLELFSAAVGMIGAGQLARMTQRAAIDLGIRLEVLAVDEHAPAVLAGASWTRGRPDDRKAIFDLAERCDVITLDHELVPGDVLAELIAHGIRVIPEPSALMMAQDKLFARRALANAGLPTPPFAEVRNSADLTAFASSHGWPVVLKAATAGYDGRGVEIVGSMSDAEAVLSRGGVWLVEELVDLRMELSVLVAKRSSGDLATYPLIETVQIDGICRELVMPARVDPKLESEAIAVGLAAVALGEVSGIVAVELFVTSDGRVLVNEFAMRPHNSGHATFEGCVTSQFHNHLRAVLDWPLGDTDLKVPAVAMVNLLGSDIPGTAMASLPVALEDGAASVHLYGKPERSGRKIGHVTAVADTTDEALAIARRTARRMGGSLD